MEEEWKDIKGYEGLYQVSNLGRVRSLERIITYTDGRVYVYKSKILKQRINKRTGYVAVEIHFNGKTKTYRSHRLVAEAFIPNPNNLPEVNHKNEIKTDNRVENLEWCDRKYNTNYGNRCEKYRKARLGDNYKKEYFCKKEWYEDNKEVILQKQREYYQKHKEEKSKYTKDYYQKNRDKKLARAREMYRKKKAGLL